jgi:hypothetical protein
VWAISAHFADSNSSVELDDAHLCGETELPSFQDDVAGVNPSKYSRCSGVILKRVGLPSLSVIQ